MMNIPPSSTVTMLTLKCLSVEVFKCHKTAKIKCRDSLDYSQLHLLEGRASPAAVHGCGGLSRSALLLLLNCTRQVM
jgi:hypothetical protein